MRICSVIKRKVTLRRPTTRRCFKMNEQNIKIEKSPSVSIGRLIKDNWYLIKTVFSASPLSVSLYAFEQFRVQVLVFLEHTWLIQTVLECIEYKKPTKLYLLRRFFCCSNYYCCFLTGRQCNSSVRGNVNIVDKRVFIDPYFL